MGKEVVVHIYNGLLLSQRKEQIWVSWTEVDKPRACYTEWSKSEREKEMRVLTHTYGIWKDGTDEPCLQSRKRDRDLENSLVGSARGGEGGTNLESNWNITMCKTDSCCLYNTGHSTSCSGTTERGGMGQLRGRVEREGLYAHLRLTHLVVWQKPTQHCKATIFQLKINFKEIIPECYKHQGKRLLYLLISTFSS